jgi:hypothetical protein
VAPSAWKPWLSTNSVNILTSFIFFSKVIIIVYILQEM